MHTRCAKFIIIMSVIISLCGSIIPFSFFMKTLIDECLYERCDIETYSTVVSNNDGKVVYNFNNMNCTINHYGGSSVQVGSNAYIFTSESGECADEKDKRSCSILPVITGILASCVFIFASCCIGGGMQILLKEFKPCQISPEENEISLI